MFGKFTTYQGGGYSFTGEDTDSLEVISHRHVSLTHVSPFLLSPLSCGSGRSVSAYNSYLQHHQQQQQHVPQGLPPQLHPFQQQQMSALSNAGNYSSQFYKGLSVQGDNFQQVGDDHPDQRRQGVFVCHLFFTLSSRALNFDCSIFHQLRSHVRPFCRRTTR